MKGKMYTLSESQKEQYKNGHPHIAPDVRDEASQRSALSDMSRLGRMMKLDHNFREKISKSFQICACITTCIHAQRCPKSNSISMRCN